LSISAHMAANVSQIQQTLGLALLQSAQSTQAAEAMVMLEDFEQAQQHVQNATHPHLGKQLDIEV
jgi:hypothetical protein